MRYVEIGSIIAFFVSLTLNISTLPKWLTFWPVLLVLGGMAATQFAVLLLKSMRRWTKTIDRLVKSAFFIIVAVAAPNAFVSTGSITAVVGILLNETVVLANGMRMPAKLPLWAGIKLPLPELPEGYAHAGPHTKLYWLCDRIWCLGALLSVGDFVLTAGLYIAALGFWLR